jgi:hypothetical protein
LSLNPSAINSKYLNPPAHRQRKLSSTTQTSPDGYLAVQSTLLPVGHALHSKLPGLRSHFQPLLSYQTTTLNRDRNRQNMANGNHSDQQTCALESWEPSASSPNPAAMSAPSPTDQYGNPTGGSGYGSGQSDSGKSPLSMSLGFLKNLTEKKSTRGACSLSCLNVAPS